MSCPAAKCPGGVTLNSNSAATESGPKRFPPASRAKDRECAGPIPGIRGGGVRPIRRIMFIQHDNEAYYLPNSRKNYVKRVGSADTGTQIFRLKIT